MRPASLAAAPLHTAAALLLLVACEREDRNDRPAPARAARDETIALVSIQPGGGSGAVRTRNPYEENAVAVAEGQRLFRAYNCNGCHANGGGGMGPPLMDDQWIYGSDPANIVATILEGRPNGMPSFRGKVSDDQAMKLAAYVRSMSGQLRKDVAPGRSDHMTSPVPQSTPRETPKDSAIPPSAEGR
jgi:cytochrome c oxidase cbb3-type subunit 3